MYFLVELQILLSGFASSSTLNSMEMEYAEGDSLQQTFPNLQKHECLYCHKTFTYAAHLVRHIRIHTGEQPYVCQICQKAFNEASNLQQHMIIHSGIKPFKCSVCDYSSTQSSNLKRHMLNKH